MAQGVKFEHIQKGLDFFKIKSMHSRQGLSKISLSSHPRLFIGIYAVYNHLLFILYGYKLIYLTL